MKRSKAPALLALVAITLAACGSGGSSTTTFGYFAEVAQPAGVASA